jgi:hypothetical protein
VLEDENNNFVAWPQVFRLWSCIAKTKNQPPTQREYTRFSILGIIVFLFNAWPVVVVEHFYIYIYIYKYKYTYRI